MLLFGFLIRLFTPRLWRFTGNTRSYLRFHLLLMLLEETRSTVALMVVDNIDNLECTLSGSGTSHRVNSILVTELKEEERGHESDDQEYVPPVAKKCRRSLPVTVVSRDIPDYYGGKREGPGELQHVQSLR